MKNIVLGLGSNKSYENFSSIELLKKAISLLSEFISDVKISSVYRTKPMYVENQDCFYNMVLAGKISDDFSAAQLLIKNHQIESFLGRNRSKEIRFGPRSIDIDIEFFGDEKISTADLEIPHPRLQERAFVLKPLLEILKKNSDVLKREKISEIESYLKNLSDDDDVQIFMDSKEFL